jgi:hypothetical protein
MNFQLKLNRIDWWRIFLKKFTRYRPILKEHFFLPARSCLPEPCSRQVRCQRRAFQQWKAGAMKKPPTRLKTS